MRITLTYHHLSVCAAALVRGREFMSIYMCGCVQVCEWLQRSVKEESIIIHHNQLLCHSFRTHELLTRGGHGGDENHMRVKCDVYQLD